VQESRKIFTLSEYKHLCKFPILELSQKYRFDIGDRAGMIYSGILRRGAAAPPPCRDSIV
jgi:hypothetical protein